MQSTWEVFVEGKPVDYSLIYIKIFMRNVYIKSIIQKWLKQHLLSLKYRHCYYEYSRPNQLERQLFIAKLKAYRL